MNRHSRTLPVLIVLACPGLAASCAGVFHSGEYAFLTSEKVALVWNPTTRLEHFVREAAFQGKGKDFGFLVPTPTKPTLAEASQKAFTRLASLLPKSRTEGGGGFGGGGLGGPGGGIHVVHQQRVGGYDASVLAGSSSSALVEWLRQNGYDSRPSLMPWAQPYLSRNWFITAFKYARKDEGISNTGTSPVRLTFAMEVPFYPYREPKDERPRDAGTARALGLYVVAPTPMEARLRGTYQPAPTKGSSFAVPESHRDGLAEELGLRPQDLPQPMVLTFFLDQTLVRPDQDLIFVPKTTRTAGRKG